MNRKDLIVHSLRITNQDDTNVYENTSNGKIFPISPLIIEGGASIQKGLQIGLQENLVAGLMIYDGENFLGFSEKFGLTLLGVNHQSMYLEIPESVFKKKIQPMQSNTIHDEKKGMEEGIETKRLKMDIEIKDISSFYMKIPRLYEMSNFHLQFIVECIFPENRFVSEFYIIWVNESNRRVSFEFVQKGEKIHYANSFRKTVHENEIMELKIRKINQQYLLISQIFYD
jgi:hypothetical protein